MVKCHTPCRPINTLRQAREALGKLSPEDRAEFLKMLQERAAARGVKLPGKVASDPTDLGKVLTDLHQKPGQLRDILGGGQPQGQAPGSNPIIDILKSPQAKAVLAGIAAMVVKRVKQGSPERREAAPERRHLLRPLRRPLAQLYLRLLQAAPIECAGGVIATPIVGRL